MLTKSEYFSCIVLGISGGGVHTHIHTHNMPTCTHTLCGFFSTPNLLRTKFEHYSFLCSVHFFSLLSAEMSPLDSMANSQGFTDKLKVKFDLILLKLYDRLYICSGSFFISVTSSTVLRS